MGHVVERAGFGPVVGSGRPRSMDVSHRLYFVARPDKILALASGVVHPVHCLMRGRGAIRGGAAVGSDAVAPSHQHRGLVWRS